MWDPFNLRDRVFAPLTPDYAGRSAHKDTPEGPQVNGPHAYAGPDLYGDVPVGFSAGAGLISGQIGGGSGARTDVGAAQAHFGGWRDEQGDTNWGIEGDAALARVGIAPGGAIGPFGFDIGIGTANANWKMNDETSSIGAQANLAEVSGSVGTDEHNARFGVSAGVGLAGRAHYGDADNDGADEYGIGFDIGPVSADIKTEALGHVANGVGNAAGHVANGVGNAFDRVTSW